MTIIVRTKDRPSFFERALDDILNQTSTAWSLLVLNDGGAHEPVEAAVAARRDLFSTAPVIMQLEHSVGRDGVLNLALGRSTASYFAIHDDDDTWAPEFLQEAIAWLDNHSEAGAVATSTAVVIEHVTGRGIEESSRLPITVPHDTLSLFDLVLGNRIPPIGMVFRREVAEKVGGFDETLSVLGDWDFTLRVAATSPIGYIPGRPLAFWHQRPDSVGDSANSVHGARLLHSQTDRTLRDRALREHIAQHGVGGLLFVARFVDERIAATEDALTRRLDIVEGALTDRIHESAEAQLAAIDGLLRSHIAHHSVTGTLRRMIARIIRPIRRH